MDSLYWYLVNCGYEESHAYEITVRYRDFGKTSAANILKSEDLIDGTCGSEELLDILPDWENNDCI